MIERSGGLSNLSIRELNVHVRIDADETALVLGLTPFQANDDILIDTLTLSAAVHNGRAWDAPGSCSLEYVQSLQHRPRVYWHNLFPVSRGLAL